MRCLNCDKEVFISHKSPILRHIHSNLIYCDNKKTVVQVIENEVKDG